MATPAENWKVVKELFEAALEEVPARRPSFLEEHCDDAKVRAEVKRLLAEHEQARGSLSAPTLDQLHPRQALGTPRRKIGSYYLIERIGEGGMGEVWLAEQKVPVRRRVAIKLIKAGMDTREVVARFESERQALALMDHPTIAKVFDAGSTPDGRPYFVMEYVAGTPITTYCDRHKLTTRQRMELFIQVCEGVQHAHQKAIIHRDLKPSNILVSDVGGKPVPRIIDFGLAKATSQRLTEDSINTRVGAVVGTLEYMSPEQADSGGEDIDTRTDVYSLGVILYQLLAGALPLELKKLAYKDMLLRLREEDVPRPSSRILSPGGDSAITARNRGTDPPSLTRQLRGDPDAVVLKALEKDRKRRYSSPSELAEDLARYLRNEPVTAHPPSATYHARKYIRRHVWEVAAGMAALLMAVCFVVDQGIETTKIRNEGARANRNLRLADEAVEESLSSAGAQQSQEAAGSPDAEELRNQLEQNAERLYQELSDEVPNEENASAGLARALLNLGDIDRLQFNNQNAAGDYNKAIERFSQLAKGNQKSLDYQQDLGYCYNWLGVTYWQWMMNGDPKPAQDVVSNAKRAYDRAIQIQQQLLKVAPNVLDYQQDLARTYYNRGNLLNDTNGDPQSDYKQAIDDLNQRIRSGDSTTEPTAVPEPPPEQELARVESDLGVYLVKTEQYAQAELDYQMAIQTVSKLGTSDPRNYEYKYEEARYYINLAAAFGDDGRIEQAKQANDAANQLINDLAKPSQAVTKLSSENSAMSNWIDGKGKKQPPGPIAKK